MAYYIASINLESTYHDLVPDQEYEPNPVMIWTDTFADHDAKDFIQHFIGREQCTVGEDGGVGYSGDRGKSALFFRPRFCK